jgi:hypothetical protein
MDRNIAFYILDTLQLDRKSGIVTIIQTLKNVSC